MTEAEFRALSEPDARAAIVAEAMSWVRTPYIAGGCIKGAGADCGMILLGIFAGVGAVKWEDPRPYPEQFHLHAFEERYLGIVARLGHEIKGPPKPGDAVLFRYGHCYSHGGVVKEWPFIVHTMRPEGCTVDNVERCVIGPRALAKLPRRYFSVWPDEAVA